MASATAGDHEAFGELYRRFGGAVHGILLSRVSREEVDDVVQDVFLRAWTELRALRDPVAFGGWIGAIARRRAAEHHRRARVHERLPDGLVAGQNPDIAAEAGMALAVIRTLPEAYRETLMLRLVEGLSGPEIAVATGLTPESVRVNLHRGFRLLRERLGVSNDE